MEEYSTILSLDTTPNEISLYDITDVKIEKESQQYSFEYDKEIIKNKDISYKVERIENDNTQIDYSEDLFIPANTHTEKHHYDTVKNISPTKPINFKESDEKAERLSLQSIKSYTDIKDDISPIQVLQSSEPDFMQNMYNIYLLSIPAYCKNDPAKAFKMGTTLGTYRGQMTDSGRDYLATNQSEFFSIIGMRTDGIEIAQKQAKVADVKFCGQNIKKILGQMETPNKASFTVALDQSMFILDAFHRLNGDWWAREKDAFSALDTTFLKSGVSSGNLITGKEFLLNFGTLSKSNLKNDMNIIDVIVEYDAAYQIQSRYNDIAQSSDANDNTNILASDNNAKVRDDRFLTRDGRVQRYILHDCRFLGRSSSITFNQDTAEPIKATFPFVYRRVLKVNDKGYIY